MVHFLKLQNISTTLKTKIKKNQAISKNLIIIGTDMNTSTCTKAIVQKAFELINGKKFPVYNQV